MTEDIFSQESYRCRLDWGFIGTERAILRGDIIVIVDTLSFSTTTTYAVSRGALIFPCTTSDDAKEVALRVGGVPAVQRSEVPRFGRYSLSPFTFYSVSEGEKVVLPSLNGSACSSNHAATNQVFAGALVNATAVSSAVTECLADGSGAVTIIACGEREKVPQPAGDLRVAIEDWLGAGAIIARLNVSKSPEARLCEIGFVSSARYVADLAWDCISGRELRAAGYGEDVKFAAELDTIDTVPTLRNGAFIKL